MFFQVDNLNSEHLFEEVFNFYNQSIFRFICGKVKDCYQANEIRQEVFIHIWKYRNHLEKGGIEAIVFKTCGQEIYKFYSHNFRIPLTFFLEDLKLYLQDESEAKLEEVFKKEVQLHRLHSAIDSLPDKRNSILMANKIECKTQKELASEMNMSKSVVGNQISKAMLFLRLKLTS